MTFARLALVAALSSCMVGDDDVASDPVQGDENQTAVSQTLGPPDDPDLCSLLPTCGPCSLACDIPALAEQYVPLGTCVAFDCELSDGRQIAVHACHP